MLRQALDRIQRLDSNAQHQQIRADAAEASVVTMTAAMTTLGENRSQGTSERTQLVDKKLGHPEKFSSEDNYWPDRSFVVLGYVGSLSGQLVRLMNLVALSELQVDWDLQTGQSAFLNPYNACKGRGVDEVDEAS